jgi:cell division septation protein DedD
MPISPQSPAPAADKRIAAVNPAPAQDAAADAAPAAEDSGYLVSVSSQKSEADAQASFRALKTKYADAMGSYSAPVIKRVDIPGKGVMYRAMVGPFDTSEAANQFCKSLQSAGGQCFVPKK